MAATPIAVGAGPAPGAAAAGTMSTATTDDTGASYLARYAAALGHHVVTLSGDLDPPPGPAVLFVLAPETAFSDGEAARLRRWVEAGGILVYSASGDPRLDAHLDLTRGPAVEAEVIAHPAYPVFDDLADVDLPAPTPFALPLAEQVVFLADDAGAPEGMVTTFGAGRAYALAADLVFSNAALHDSGNAALAADLIDLVPASAPVLFDETHHASAAAGGFGWVGTPWGAGLLWGTLALFVALALRGRAFGPRVPLPSRQPGSPGVPGGTGPDPSSAEYTAAVGRLLRRSRARQQTLRVLDAAARRALAERVGLHPELPPEELAEALAVRAPDLARRLARAEAALAAAKGDDERLRKVAAELHDLAHPSEDKI